MNREKRKQELKNQRMQHEKVAKDRQEYAIYNYYNREKSNEEKRQAAVKDIIAIKNKNDRQQAIKQNIDLFR